MVLVFGSGLKVTSPNIVEVTSPSIKHMKSEVKVKLLLQWILWMQCVLLKNIKNK